MKLIIYVLMLIFVYILINKKSNEISILLYTAIYGTKQLNLFYALQNSIVDVCEGGIYIKVIAHHTDISPNSILYNKKYCQKLNIYIAFEYIKCNKSMGTYLTSQHRYHIRSLGREIDKYNFIGYIESDVILELKHINYYITSYNIMKKLGKYYIPGFVRYVIYKDKNGEIYRRTPDLIDFVLFKSINGICFVEMQDAFSSFWLMPKEIVNERISDRYFYELPHNFFRRVWVKEYFSFFYWKKFIHYYVLLQSIDNCYMNHASNKNPFHFTSIDVENFFNQIGYCKSDDNRRHIVHKCRGSKKINYKLQHNTCNYNFNEKYNTTISEHADLSKYLPLVDH